MRFRISAILALAVLCLLPAVTRADLAAYSQDFEALAPAPDPVSLAADGWLIFGNVFPPDGNGYLYGYGVYPAPNHGGAFSAVIAGEGGPAQGAQQLNIFSDYANTDHGAGNLIESNVFQEQWIGAADAGTTWTLKFDAKRGNIEGTTTAKAFFKTIDPATGYSLSSFVWIDMTNVPDGWTSYSLSFYVAPQFVGQIFQFGFLTTTTYWQGSGIYYDNLNFLRSVDVDVKPGSCPNPISMRSRGVLPVAILGSETLDVYNIDPASLRLEGLSPLATDYEDVAGPYSGDLCGCTEAGPDGFLDLTLKFKARDISNLLRAATTGDSRLTVSGTLMDGTPFEGVDCYVTVGTTIDRNDRRPQILEYRYGDPDLDTDLDMVDYRR